ncbi:SRPBCC family protein [Solitalea koreensis]|uniref:Polyketide cyclase / dehydrase and lipid transport n=1 Tax=Solitalea koreensis TaxID=543615 RepID=A0A521BAQ7_9SPHI|nr:SRPBCC family protein [Solitalea koreensis]SMO44155.1 Polyketide cyclase / dehydrase and lipid transport [Solitalea koreensis]
MKILKKTLLAFIALLFLLVIISFFLPSAYKVQRSTIIKAPVDQVFAQFNDLNSWLKWNAFDDDFKDIKYTTSNPSSGAGATQSWLSKKMNGSMTITESIPNKLVKLTLLFEGFNDPLLGEVQFDEVPEGTKVTWTDEGNMGNNPMYKIMGLFMDSMMGKNMEKSFLNVKGICEK